MISMKEIQSKIKIIQGDITLCSIDALVNAANKSLLGGGGVDGAIHHAAGPSLLAECRTLHGCETGEAKVTKGYNLKAQYVIHTVGPVYKNGLFNEANLLSKCYYNSMKCAYDLNLTSIAFPAISTGIYHYPKKEACEIAITTTVSFMKDYSFYPEISFILFDRENFDIYVSFVSSFFSNLTEEKNGF